MKKSYLWTHLKARLQWIRSKPGYPYNWLFLPGGPGLGSESLAELTAILDLPGTIWHLDLPGDGSNTTEDNAKAFSKWTEALVEAVSSLDDVILVAHSTGGMYALATPELETKLKGLVLMSTAPDNSWQALFGDYVQKHVLAGVDDLHQAYIKNPCNKTLCQLTIASAAYSFRAETLKKGQALLEKLPYNYESMAWSSEHFDSTYEAQWIPQNLPTLIFTGEVDHIIPLDFFRKAAAFQRNNIHLREIKKAAHFPWIDNPEAVIQAFTDYLGSLEEKHQCKS